MFKVILFACMIQAPDQCLQIDDTWGLKATQEECEARIKEMIEGIRLLLPQYEVVGAKCEHKGDMI